MLKVIEALLVGGALFGLIEYTYYGTAAAKAAHLVDTMDCNAPLPTDPDEQLTRQAFCYTPNGQRPLTAPGRAQ